MTSNSLVSFLLEDDLADEVGDASEYIASTAGSHPIDVITTKEWRSYFRSLGYRIVYISVPKSEKYRKHILLNLTLMRKDGGEIDWQEEKLVCEYAYELIEKRLASIGNRNDVKVEVSSICVGRDSVSGRRDYADGRNLLILSVRPTNSDTHYCHYNMYPLYMH